MFKRQLALLIAATFALPLISVQAQDAQPRRRVVGIALSGGGSLGLAHIGVLQYLEEHRIPVDRIAGTSIGGLVGGLYATGHNAADLKRIVRDANWGDLMSTTPKFEDSSVTEKQEWNRITGQYSLRLGPGFGLPSGITTGHSLVLLLSGETAAYSDVRNFDDLPIPFRCVATDLLAGEAFILKEGFLPKALRATMALPGIFTPVDWGGRILSDGGLVNNLPADVVKGMGADIVIGVTLRGSPSSAAALNSLTTIFRQSVNVALLQNELRNVPLADINVEVQLGNRGSLDFSDTQSIIELGYKAAAQNQSALEKLSLPPEQWEEYIRTRKLKERTAPPSGPLLDVSASQPGIQRNATDELLRRTGATVSRSRLEDILSGLTAVTGIPYAYYGWHSVAGEKPGFRVELEPRPSPEIRLRPSFFYQWSPGEPSRPTFRLSASAIPKDAYKSRFLADLNIGSNPALDLEYYYPFAGTAYFAAPGVSAERAHFSTYVGKAREDETRDRVSGWLYFGMGTWRHVQLRAGTQAGLDWYSRPITVNGAVASNSRFANVEIAGIVNSQDSGQLPSRGSRVNGSTGWSFTGHPYPYLKMDFDHFHPVGDSVSVFVVGQTDTSMGRKLTFYDQFTSGGLLQMDAYRYQELRGNTVMTAGGGILYRGVNPNNAAFRPIFGSWYEAAGMDSFTPDSRFRQSATLGVFTPTPLGLAGLTFSVDMKGTARFRFSIGSFWNRP